LVALNVEDVEFGDDGLVVSIRRSKADQEGVGRQVGIPYGSTDRCPVTALRRWLAAAHITTGPVFRRVDRHGHLGTGRLCSASVAQVIKRAAAQAGISPEGLSGHSLRAGLATAAAANGATVSRSATAAVVLRNAMSNVEADHPAAVSRLLKICPPELAR
jgi:integrase